MSKAQEAIALSVSEIEKLKRQLTKSKAVQIQSVEERALLSATSRAWFNSHRKELSFIGGVELKEIDNFFHDLLESSDKRPSRKLTVEKITNLRKSLFALRTKIIDLSSSPTLISTADSPPNFSSLISDSKMREILNKRWNECSICIAHNANLAGAVMIGGLIEGLILIKVNQEVDKSKIFKAKCAPTDKITGKVKQINEWKLNELIALAFELGWLSKPARDISSVLRDYRNYIHPHKELAEGVQITQSDSKMFWELAKSITRQLLGTT